jgi:hypothetical protein
MWQVVSLMLLRLRRCAEIIGVRHILREPTDNPPADARAGRSAARPSFMPELLPAPPEAAQLLEKSV